MIELSRLDGRRLTRADKEAPDPVTPELARRIADFGNRAPELDDIIKARFLNKKPLGAYALIGIIVFSLIIAVVFFGIIPFVVSTTAKMFADLENSEYSEEVSEDLGEDLGIETIFESPVFSLLIPLGATALFLTPLIFIALSIMKKNKKRNVALENNKFETYRVSVTEKMFRQGGKNNISQYLVKCGEMIFSVSLAEYAKISDPAIIVIFYLDEEAKFDDRGVRKSGVMVEVLGELN